jgi:hypothetical protein
MLGGEGREGQKGEGGGREVKDGRKIPGGRKEKMEQRGRKQRGKEGRG